MIPNSRMGSIIGKQGAKIKEIQDASGARLNASEGMLPGSTEVSSVFEYARLSLLTIVLSSEYSASQALPMQYTLLLIILVTYLSNARNVCHHQRTRFTDLQTVRGHPLAVVLHISQDTHRILPCLPHI